VSTRRRSGLLLSAIIWIVAAVGGFLPLLDYAARPGPSATAPASLAAAATAGRARLIMTIHPHCACSRASLRELERMLAHVPTPIDAQVLFVGREDAGNELLRQAQDIAGVVIDHDRSGERARTLGALTSGDVLFYDASGALRFHGGLTTARGHEGPSAGRDTILAVLAARAATVSSTPAFGCRLGGSRE
jgi:hypothetical protein